MQTLHSIFTSLFQAPDSVFSYPRQALAPSSGAGFHIHHEMATRTSLTNADTVTLLIL